MNEKVDIVMGSGSPAAGVTKVPVRKTINNQDRKDLKWLADDFGLSQREDIQKIIETCKSYAEGQR